MSEAATGLMLGSSERDPLAYSMVKDRLLLFWDKLAAILSLFIGRR